MNLFHEARTGAPGPIESHRGGGNGKSTRKAAGFDPLADLLVAQAVKPPQLSEVNLRTLTPFQRALLVIDGTVTKFIEAYTMEPVEIVRLSQELCNLAGDHAWLEAEEGTQVIARQVLLQGVYSHAMYAYAVSLLVFDRLPDTVKRDLETNPGGLGRILIDHRLDTRREVLWYGRERLDDLPEPINDLGDGRFISRTYRILSGESPLMLINEKFPADIGNLLSHH